MSKPIYDVKIARRDDQDATPIEDHSATACKEVGRVVWARGEAALIAHQLGATEGADVEFLERLVDGAAKRASRLLISELAKFADAHPAIKSFVTGEPFERVVTEAIRDPKSGRLIGSTTLKFRAG